MTLKNKETLQKMTKGKITYINGIMATADDLTALAENLQKKADAISSFVASTNNCYITTTF